MSQIKQLLQLHQQGKSIKFIARSLGISKNTVKAYLAKVALSQLDVQCLLALDDPIMEGKFHAGNPAYKDERFEHLKANLDYFSKELGRVGVTKQLLWKEYRSDYPQGYSRSQFCYHLSQQLVARKPSMVLQHQAGEKLFIDFAGKKLSYIEADTGEIVPCQVFVACLPYSDYSFAMAVRSQNIGDFLYALGCCLQELGGVPQVLVPDNLKSAIVKANGYEPDVNRALEDFANHYHTTVIPARARKPKDKALVENQVKLVYSRVYAKLRNQQFFDLGSLNKAIREKVGEHNQTRMQQKPYCREEKYLADEKHVSEKWCILYIERWLQMPVQTKSGERIQKQGKGTPQGGVISPLLANLFQHYAMDKWLEQTHPTVSYVRYADDAILHCRNKVQAEEVLETLKERMQSCGLELHPEKTKLVYCRDYRRQENHETVKFDFLGHSFQPRSTMSKRTGKLFLGFDCAISISSKKRIADKMKELNIDHLSHKSIVGVALFLEPYIRGWINYYGRFRLTALKPIFQLLREYLVKWARKRYKRYKTNLNKAYYWLKRVKEQFPNLFYQWKLGFS